MSDRIAETRVTTRFPVWAMAVALLVGIAAVLVGLALLGGRSLPDRNGPPVEELAVERTVLHPGLIELTIRNTGPDAVRVAQVFVNDSYVDVAGGTDPISRLQSTTLRLNYPWQDGQPYLVSLLTSSGAVVQHQIPIAVATPDPGGVLGLMALLGTYVGIIPVALGMLVLPVLRRVSPTVVRVLLALTVGLLGFLVVDGSFEAIGLSQATGGAFGGPALVILGAGLAFLALTAVDGILKARRQRAAADGAVGLPLSLMIAIGIGLHNLGEGLAIGSAYAVGELALGAFLVVGFALHNTTEGLAIVAPLAAILGATVSNAELSAFLIGVGVGAIIQVVVQIAPAIRDRAGQVLNPASIGGITAGVLVMYVTGLLVSA